LSATSESKNNRLYSDSSSASGSLSANIQASSDTDRTLGRQILREVRTDTSLSSAMTGVKFAIDNGKVTLKGNVRSEEQKKNIEASVKKVTGVSSVDNQLEVSATGAASVSAETK
jgi:hyperosmotically inducible protein